METPKNILNVSGNCLYYVRVFSDGILSVKPGDSILQHGLVRFHIQLAIMIIPATLFHCFFKRINLSRISSDFLTGFILGPTLLGRYLSDKSKLLLFPKVPNQVIASLCKLGFIMLMFLSTARIDPTFVTRLGKRAVISGALIFIIPFIMSNNVQLQFATNAPSVLSMGTIAAKSQFAVMYLNSITTSQFANVTHMLLQLKISNSRLGRQALGLTLMSDLSNELLGVVRSTYRALYLVGPGVGTQTILITLMFVPTVFIIMKILIRWFIRNTPEDKQMKDIYTSIMVVTLLLLASMGDAGGIHYMFFPFLLGLLVPAGSPLATALIPKLDTFVSGLLLPITFVYCGTKFNFLTFLKFFEYALYFKISLLAYMIKLIVTYVIVIFGIRASTREAAALSLILNAKGIIEIATFFSFGSIEIENVESTSGIFLVFLLSLSAPFVKLLYDPEKHYIGYKKKSIQHAPQNAELRILACTYKQEDAVAAVKLLEYSNPTKQSPLSVYGLCLEELISISTPLLINHQLGQKNSSSQESRSQPIIDIFGYFQSQHDKSTHVHVFTAISPVKQLHEDVCFLAFDKSAYFIILPYHKKWNSKGKMVSNNHELRNLNMDVLNRAPCSVGILVDRRRTHGLSSVFVTSVQYNVAVLFVGGADDREALAYALRMAGSPNVQLTVIHFSTHNDGVHDRWEAMLDSESLRGLKHLMSKIKNINYIEEIVRDGSNTASVVHSIEDSFDLVMVGRRHETRPEALSGLSEWAEVPELGPLGDLLASEDINSAISVLVVQQQILKVLILHHQRIETSPDY